MKENNKTILSAEEIIRRIEMAPPEMQTMVAKAFIRDDIDNDDIQYLYNEDDLDVLVEDGEVENINEVEIEGIGADGFIMRTTKPNGSNKNYVRKASGGWNPCVKGNPRDPECDVIANCVGWVCGRWNEVINEILGTTGCKYDKFCCNAENFVEKAKAYGLETGSTPRLGAIMVWQKGATLSGVDGAGHVAYVEKVYSNKKVYTSESAYGGKVFYNVTRTNDNNRWGMGSAYTFRCFIYLPANIQKLIDGTVDPIDPEPIPAPTPTPQPDKKETTFKVGDKVKIVGTGNGSSYGKSNTAYGIGWSRQILKVWNGRAYPYQVGNNKGTTGFYKAEALKKK